MTPSVNFRLFCSRYREDDIKLLKQDSLPTMLFRRERATNEKKLIPTTKDIPSRFKHEGDHQELGHVFVRMG